MSRSRVIVVTGGNSGIGLAITKKFADNGDKVQVLGINEQKLSDTAKYSQNIETFICDVTMPVLIEKTRDNIIKRHQKIDVLINCAGGNFKANPSDGLVDANELWQKIIDLNLTGVFNVIYAFLPHLSRPGARVINISSLAALKGSSQPAANGQAYASAKAGVHGLSRTLVEPLAKDGITINCVAPGVIDDTGFFGGSGVPHDRVKPNIDKIPLGRLGEPNDIAAGVFYLASDEASFITGEILNINGGAVFGR